MRISDWSSDVCSSDLRPEESNAAEETAEPAEAVAGRAEAMPEPGPEVAAEPEGPPPETSPAEPAPEAEPPAAEAAEEKPKRKRAPRRRCMFRPRVTEIGRAHV